jgi:hypothetical protein
MPENVTPRQRHLASIEWIEGSGHRANPATNVSVPPGLHGPRSHGWSAAVERLHDPPSLLGTVSAGERAGIVFEGITEELLEELSYNSEFL